MSDYLDSYKQIANGHPDDSYEPGEGKQRVDLVEFYAETKQDSATMMVTGTEALSLGKLSKRVGVYFKLPGAAGYDPFPSERNARAGQEGFISTLRDGFKTFIENIIKYIRMAVDWVVDTVKGVFGFRKSKRVNKAINDSLGDLKKEFVTTLSGLGFPASEYNLENFIGNLPPNQDRLAQLTLLKSKFETDQQAIDGLCEALPLLQQSIAKLTAGNDKVTVSAKKLKGVIAQEHTKTRVRAGNPDLQLSSAAESPEVNRIVKACLEVRLGLDTAAIAEQLGKLYEALYKTSFSNDELLNGWNDVRKKIQDTVHTESVKLGKHNVSEILTSIQYLNLRYVEISDNELDLRGMNMKNVGTVIDKDDMTKVAQIATFYQYDAVLTVYQALAVDVRNFSQFCYSVSQSLMLVERQIANLVEWYNRAHAYYYHGLLEDIDSMAQINKDAAARGHSPAMDANGWPTGMVFIKDADAQTLGEKASGNLKFVIDQDIAGVKTSFNNFAKQTGWGKLV